MSWKGDHHHFAVSYSNGCVLSYSCRLKSRQKPKSRIAPHQGSPNFMSPCQQVSYFHRGSESWLLFSGGYPEGRTLGVRTLTIHAEKSGDGSKPHLLSFNDPICSFLALCPSQMGMGKQRHSHGVSVQSFPCHISSFLPSSSSSASLPQTSFVREPWLSLLARNCLCMTS